MSKKVLVVDAQGGGIGRLLVTGLKKEMPDLEVWAVGANHTAALAMKKAGADETATGENAVIVCSRRADIITGPIGIVIADSMMGEITPAIAEAIGASDAMRVLVPMNRCRTIIAGVQNSALGEMVRDAIEKIQKIVETETTN